MILFTTRLFFPSIYDDFARHGLTRSRKLDDWDAVKTLRLGAT